MVVSTPGRYHMCMSRTILALALASSVSAYLLPAKVQGRVRGVYSAPLASSALLSMRSRPLYMMSIDPDALAQPVSIFSAGFSAGYAAGQKAAGDAQVENPVLLTLPGPGPVGMPPTFWEETQSSSASPEPPSLTDAPFDLEAWLRAGGALVLMFYDRINKILPHLMYHCPPGPPVVQHRLLINAQKGGSLPFCLLLMWWRKNWSSTAVVYTGLHGSYGLIWLLKDHVFRDKSWDQRITAVSATFTIIVLGLYWLAPALVILNNLHVSPARQLLCIVVNILGQVLMMVSDCHKHFALEYHRDLAREKKYLLQEGLFATNRNPNYLGEMMVYGAFAGMCPRHEPWCVMLFLWIVVFGNNMAAKDKSLQKKPGWKEYSKRSWLFLPKPNLTSFVSASPK